MTKKSNSEITITKGDVFDDLGFTHSEASTLKVKADLLDAIRAEIEFKAYKQKELIKILDEHQPAVSNLMRGRITQISIEKLLRYSTRLGMRTQLRILPARRSRVAA